MHHHSLVKPRYLDEVLPHRKCFRWGPRFNSTGNAFGGAPGFLAVVRKTAIFERQTRKSPFRKRERTKSYVTAFLPPPKILSAGPLCGRGFDAVSRQYTPQNIRFAGTPDSAVENVVIRMRCTQLRPLVKPRYLDEVRESPHIQDSRRTWRT